MKQENSAEKFRPGNYTEIRSIAALKLQQIKYQMPE